MSHVSELNPFGFHEKKVPIKSIIRNANNPRKISPRDKKELEKSISKFGLIDKPILNKNLHLIAGHQRLSVLEEAGHLDAVCMVPEKQLSDSEEEELLIRHNKNGGEFDENKLVFFAVWM